MLKAERRARLEAAYEAVNRVYTDLCRDPEVSNETTLECCDLLQKLYAFAVSMDPRPYDYEDTPTE